MTEQQQRALAAGLKALAETTRDASASSSVEAAVLECAAGRLKSAAIDTGRLKPASTDLAGRAVVEAGLSRLAPVGAGFSRPGRWFVHAAAAALVIASLSGAWLARRAHVPPGPIHPAGFVEIPGASVLPPIESGSIVRVALTVGELPRYGIAIVPEISSSLIDVDLLIAQDGLPRAIRIADDSHNSRSTP